MIEVFIFGFRTIDKDFFYYFNDLAIKKPNKHKKMPINEFLCFLLSVECII